MKPLKMLGLAAIAALGLMAFVGAGTASATTLSTDAAGTIHYEAGTEIHMMLKLGTSVSIETIAGERIATCTTSTVGGHIDGPVVETAGKKYPSGTWILGAITSLSFGEPEGKNCSQPTKTLASGSLEIMQTAGDEGEVVGKNTSITLGIFGVSCIYGTSAEGNKLGTIKGGETTELVISAVLPKKEGGFLCPNSYLWTITYVLTSPHALHFVE